MIADAISKPSHCYGRTRGAPGRAVVGLSTACNAIGEQETCTRRLRRRTETAHPSGAQKVCTSSVGLPRPHQQPKETCPRLIWPLCFDFRAQNGVLPVIIFEFLHKRYNLSLIRLHQLGSVLDRRPRHASPWIAPVSGGGSRTRACLEARPVTQPISEHPRSQTHSAS